MVWKNHSKRKIFWKEKDSNGWNKELQIICQPMAAQQHQTKCFRSISMIPKHQAVRDSVNALLVSVAAVLFQADNRAFVFRLPPVCRIFSRLTRPQTEPNELPYPSHGCGIEHLPSPLGKPTEPCSTGVTDSVAVWLSRSRP